MSAMIRPNQEANVSASSFSKAIVFISGQQDAGVNIQAKVMCFFFF